MDAASTTTEGRTSVWSVAATESAGNDASPAGVVRCVDTGEWTNDIVASAQPPGGACVATADIADSSSNTCVDELVREYADTLFAPDFAAGRQHLFRRDYSEQMSAFLSPETLGISVVAKATETSLENNKFLSSYTNLFVPVMPEAAVKSQGHPYLLMAELGLNKGPDAVKSLFGSTNLGRVALDPRTSSALAVSMVDSDDDVCVMGIWRPTSTVGVRSVFGVFNRRKLEKAVLEHSTEQLNDAFIMAMSRYLVRNCTVCGKPPGVLCGCTLPATQIEFPLKQTLGGFIARNAGMQHGQLALLYHPRLGRSQMAAFRHVRAVADLGTSLLWRNHIRLDFDMSLEPLERLQLAHAGIAACCAYGNILRTQIFEPPTAPAKENCATLIAPMKKESVEGSGAFDSREELLRRRRERNRASAARSNARRSARNEGLKHAIALARTHVHELQARKQELEFENRQLALKLARRARSEHRPDAVAS